MATATERKIPTRETVLSWSAVTTAGMAVVAWAACCVLPMTLAVAGLSVAGTAFVAAQRGWLTLLAVPILAAGWWTVWRQTRACTKDATCPRPSRSAIWLLTVASALTAAALAWQPLIEPLFLALLRRA